MPVLAQELYDAYWKVGLTLQAAEATRLSRIAHLKSLVASLLENNLRWRTDEALRSAAG